MIKKCLSQRRKERKEKYHSTGDHPQGVVFFITFSPFAPPQVGRNNIIIGILHSYYSHSFVYLHRGRFIGFYNEK